MKTNIHFYKIHSSAEQENFKRIRIANISN